MKTTVLSLALIAAALGLAQPAAAIGPVADDNIVASFERAFDVRLRPSERLSVPGEPDEDVLAASFARTLGIAADGVVPPAAAPAPQRVAVRW